jgi:dienelactone hydrolase
MARDERVQAAIDNWYPRFVANGVDINDFQRVTSGLERWDDWCGAWSEWGAAHACLGEKAEADGFYRSAGQHFWQAAMMYHFGKFMFFHKPKEFRAAHQQVIGLYDRALPYFDPPGERVEIPYDESASIPGILRKPAHIPKPPVVILIPGLDSVKEELHAYGNDFLARGMAVLAVDGPGQGELEFDHPMRHDWEVPIRCVVDYLEERPGVDASRIGAMGVSVGGHYAARAAAFEPRLRALITNCTGYSLAENFDQLPVLTRQAYAHHLKTENLDAARAGLKPFSLEGMMEQIACPMLIIMGVRDKLYPPPNAHRMVAEAGGDTELLLLDDGNHVCNNVPYKYRPRQADWMSRALTVRAWSS